MEKTTAFQLDLMLPSRKSEDYLYTDVAVLAAGIDAVASTVCADADSEVDFVLPSAETDRPALFVASQAKKAAYYSLDGQSADIKYITIEDGADNQLTAQTIIVEVKANAQRNVVIKFAAQKGLSAVDIYIKMAAESAANVVLWQDRATKARIFTHTIVDMQKSAKLNISTINIRAAHVRNNLRINYLGENAESQISGLYIAADDNRIDNSTIVRHAVGHCTCEQLYKGVLNDHATTAFSGLIVVDPDAQKTLANQVNRSMLLSKDARAYAKPQLEIYADDVRCNHGSTTGQIDKDQLFYMQARGISEEEARQMLVAAFVCEIAERLPIEELEEKLVDSIKNSL
ncbi:MAG: Fe-S cluster assembly protein SufD [Bacteroidales bacterium]|jgi:Fe-S cluster assembly protein SufD|nr:Fe-S cluster assembly protein SufD [Bacteroidales bacterium]